MCSDFKFVSLMKTIVSFGVWFRKKSKEHFVATWNFIIMKDVTHSDFLAGVSDLFYYQYLPKAKLFLRCKGVLAFVKRLNGDDGVSKSLGISHLSEVGLISESTEGLPVLSSAASTLLKDQSDLALFHESKVFTWAKMFMGELGAVFVDHGTDFSHEIIEVLETAMFPTHTTNVHLFEMLLSYMRLHSFDRTDRKRA